jgi:hypothetical protein
VVDSLLKKATEYPTEESSEGRWLNGDTPLALLQNVVAANEEASNLQASQDVDVEAVTRLREDGGQS